MVEVALALGIATYVLVSIFGVLHVAFATQKSSDRENEAALLATAVMADLRQVPQGASVPTSPLFGINLTAPETTFYLDESGQKSETPADSAYAVTVTLNPPATGLRTATTGKVTLSWPPMAEVPTGSESFFIALNRN